MKHIKREMRHLYEIVENHKRARKGNDDRDTWPEQVLATDKRADKLNLFLAHAGKGRTTGELV